MEMEILIADRASGKTTWLIDQVRRTVIDDIRHNRVDRMLVFQVHTMQMATHLKRQIVRHFDENLCGQLIDLIPDRVFAPIHFINGDRLFFTTSVSHAFIRLSSVMSSIFSHPIMSLCSEKRDTMRALSKKACPKNTGW